MIGNLFSAVSIALLSSVFAIGEVKSIKPIAADTPNLVIGEKQSSVGEFNIYTPNMSSTFSYGFAVNNLFPSNSLETFGFNGYSSTVATDDFNLDYGLSLADNHLCNVGYYPSTSGLVSNRLYKVRFDIITTGEYLVYNGNNYVLDGFEFSPTISGTDANGDAVTIDESHLVISIADYNNLSGDEFGLCASHLLGNGISRVFRFLSITLSIHQTYLNGATNIIFWLFGDLCCNYFEGSSYGSGYSLGYSVGSSEGYTKGYAEGLGVSQNSSFMGLFSSIADTPLRFIYGLFNFDLFGTSVLVIVLTLLTGIIVFGIVKKFWK